MNQEIKALEETLYLYLWCHGKHLDKGLTLCGKLGKFVEIILKDELLRDKFCRDFNIKQGN